MKVSKTRYYSYAPLVFIAASIFGFSCAKQSETPAPTSRVFFVSPADGAVVSSPVKVVMGVEGMGIRPSADGIAEGTGHHHILINRGPYPKGVVIPKDENNRHFGGGQTEGELDLKPGDYTLTLQFADAKHQSYGPEMSRTIHIKVR